MGCSFFKTSHNTSIMSFSPISYFHKPVYVCIIKQTINTQSFKNNNMETKNRTALTVETIIKAPVEKVWNYWSDPEHIKNWAFALDTWHVPAATNDLRVGGTFSTTMAAKDGSFSFVFGGFYD